MARGGEGGKERIYMIRVLFVLLILIGSLQFCQTQNINMLNRLCRELTRLSRSKHTQHSQHSGFRWNRTSLDNEVLKPQTIEKFWKNGLFLRPLSTQSMGRHTRLISDYPMDKTDTALFTLSDNHHSSLLVKSRILWFSVKAVEICGGGNSNVSQCDSRRWPGGAWLVNKITRRVRNDYKWPQISNIHRTANQSWNVWSTPHLSDLSAVSALTICWSL